MIRTHPALRFVALALAFVLLAGLVAVAEIGQAQQNRISRAIDLSQQRQLLVSTLLHDLATAQASQRAFLLTGDRAQLGSYQAARARTSSDLDALAAADRGDASIDLARLRALTTTELNALSGSLALYESRGPQQAMTLLRGDLSQPTMVALNDEAARAQRSERAFVHAQLARAASARIWSRALMGAVALLNLMFLLAAAALLARQARRRAARTERLERENEQLERGVRRRTAELSALSSHLQHLSEKEKATLARELHDELGGLLVAVKMDVSWLQKRWPNQQPEIQARWARVLKVLDDGVDFKRRVVESLRPTLLDNIGLLPAVRWVTQEYCSRAGLQYTEIYPEHEPQLTEDAAIMVFRLVQESLTNVVKHAHATHVQVAIAMDEREMTVLVQDNGVGIDAERRDAIGSHGLAIMRHRVRSCGGTLEISNAAQGGTRVFARLPLAGILRTPGAAHKPAPEATPPSAATHAFSVAAPR
jgi:signal transduction histidine kinase